MTESKSKRTSQKQIWVDETFEEWLRKLKAMKELDGESVGNLAEITRQIIGVDAIREVEKQLLKGNSGLGEIRIRLDTRRILGK